MIVPGVLYYGGRAHQRLVEVTRFRLQKYSETDGISRTATVRCLIRASFGNDPHCSSLMSVKWQLRKFHYIVVCENPGTWGQASPRRTGESDSSSAAVDVGPTWRIVKRVCAAGDENFVD